MGFHVLNIDNGELIYDYVECFEELSYIDFITDDTIIYQGEEHWKPFKVSENEKYKHFAKGWFRAGIQAQAIFREQATQAGFILDELNQDQKSFKSYTKNAENISIKRGDFLIRNYGNIEIDVKCRGFREKNGKLCFDFKCDDAIKHQNMQKFTNTPVLIAVYENRNDTPVEETVYLISIDDILTNKNITIHERYNIGECFQIPLDETSQGFDLIDITHNKNLKRKNKTHSVKEKRIECPNAYAKWTIEDDNNLEMLYCEGKTISEICHFFGRNGGSIRARIKKLELKEKYD